MRTQTASSPIILQRLADTHWPSLHTSSHQQFTGEQRWMERAGWVQGQPQASLCLRREERRQEGWKEEKAEVQEHSAAQWTGPGQHRLRHNLIQDCQCLIILVGLTSFLYNIIVVLLYWSSIQQLYQKHNGNQKWIDGSFVLAAEPLLKYSWPVVYLRHCSSSSEMLSSLSRMSGGYLSLPKQAQSEINMYFKCSLD